MKKGKIFTKMYTIAMILIMVFAMTTIAYGYSLNNSFSYYSQHGGYVNFTERIAKGDDSSAIVAYDYGPSNGTIMYVEIWGSKYWNGTYVNHTLRHAYNGSYVTYYIVNKGEQALIPNLVYETYGMSAFTKLRMYITTSGNVNGRWSPTTR